MCGFGHSGMRGWIYVHTADEYAKWAAENLPAGGGAAPAEQKDEKKAESTMEGKAKS